MTTRTTTETMPGEHFDVLIIGAGISGIDAAYRLQTGCPGRTYAILEARDAIGGTWDLFRYPGVRSDSDMHTLGFPFRPWGDEKVIAGGESIRAYVKETAEAYSIDRKIRFGHRVKKAEWSSKEARWTVEVQTGDTHDVTRFTCSFLSLCSGYYDYAGGYTPEFPGVNAYKGTLVHPQQWPEGLDHAGKRVVVIGSGATAVTLVPALAETAAHVTMLQRSPTYILSRPAEDPSWPWAMKYLPEGVARASMRWKSIALAIGTYAYARRWPAKTKELMLGLVRKDLAPHVDVEKHFTPTYAPWDQRICLVPDKDLFHALNSGKASVVTDHIESFTETGLKLRSGEMLDADIVVTATGLVVKLMGGLELSVDGEKVDASQKIVYKGMMLDGVPNMAFAFGYTNASWTLKVDLTAQYVCRLLAHMDRNGYRVCAPHQRDPSVTREPMLDFTSGYVKRAGNVLPQQGSRAPWRVHQNYARDLAVIKYGKVDDGVMEFRRA